MLALRQGDELVHDRDGWLVAHREVMIAALGSLRGGDGQSERSPRLCCRRGRSVLVGCQEMRPV